MKEFEDGYDDTRLLLQLCRRVSVDVNMEVVRQMYDRGRIFSGRTDVRSC